jgi:hypothetical protein
MMAHLPSTAVMTYLNQWLKVYTGGRVVLSHEVSGSINFLVFKCTCGDNHHEGSQNFESVLHPTGIPWGLEQFCYKHRHICHKYATSSDVDGRCSMCGWPYDAHNKQEYMKQVGALVPPPVPPHVPPPFPLKKLEPLKIYTGRKFRD